MPPRAAAAPPQSQYQPQPAYQAPGAGQIPGSPQVVQTQFPQDQVAQPQPTAPIQPGPYGSAQSAPTAPPAVTSPDTLASGNFHSKDRAGHYETDENGIEKYIPKPAPDASRFAPPPVRRDKVAPSSKSRNSLVSASVKTPVSTPVGGSRPPPTLPPRKSVSAASGEVSGPSDSESPLAPPPASSSAPASAPAEDQPERKSIKFVDIDISKFGPPPPRIFRGNEPPPKHRGGRASHSLSVPQSAPPHAAESAPAHPSTGSFASTPSPPPPELPTRRDLAKVPPPKPVKPAKPPKPLFARSASEHAEASSPHSGFGPDEFPSTPPPLYEEHGHSSDSHGVNEPKEIEPLRSENLVTEPEQTQPEQTEPEESELRKPSAQSSSASSTSQVPNFAAQIAQLRSVNKDAVKEPEHKLHAPPKPAKRGDLSRPPKPAKPDLKRFSTNESSKETEEPPVIKPQVKPDVIKPKPKPVVLSSDDLPPPMPQRPSAESVPEDHGIKGPPPKPAKLHGAPAKPKPPAPKPKHVESLSHVKPEISREEHLVPEVHARSHPEVRPKPELKPEVKPEARSKLPEAGTPPPPPPSRSARSEPTHNATPPPPPPARNYHRAAVPVPKQETGPPDLDLELASGWFANTTSPLELPKSLEGLNYSSSYLYSTRTTPMGNFSDHTREVLVTLKDLAKVTYLITWKNNDPSTASSIITKFVPSPITNRRLLKQDLVSSSHQFGDHVAAWCLHREGQQVGSGECWDLARDALAKGCGNHAFVSTYYHHGYPILELRGSPSGSSIVTGPEDEIRKGDILQFTRAKLENKATGATQTAGDPNHTSVVVDKIGDRVLVAEQNVQGVRKVRRGEYVLPHLVAGSVVVYRPVSAQWAE